MLHQHILNLWNHSSTRTLGIKVFAKYPKSLARIDIICCIPWPNTAEHSLKSLTISIKIYGPCWSDFSTNAIAHTPQWFASLLYILLYSIYSPHSMTTIPNWKYTYMSSISTYSMHVNRYWRVLARLGYSPNRGHVTSTISILHWLNIILSRVVLGATFQINCQFFSRTLIFEFYSRMHVPLQESIALFSWYK